MDENCCEELDTRLEWIEPQVRMLAASETALEDGRGGDGNMFFIDCTRS